MGKRGLYSCKRGKTSVRLLHPATGEAEGRSAKPSEVRRTRPAPRTGRDLIFSTRTTEQNDDKDDPGPDELSVAVDGRDSEGFIAFRGAGRDFLMTF